MEEFKKAYKSLNKAQREAVDAIDGPVLVVAGPGTGKTQLLSTRVANILLKTDTDASSVLCLTFTNKAATNMRERLFQLIGPTSRNVVVRTFHSFAADIMNQYPDCFWKGARLGVAPDAVQLEIVQGILAALPLDNPLASTFAGAFTQLSDVQQALKLAKEAGLTPDELRNIVQANLGYIDSIEPRVVDMLSPPLSAKNLSKLQTALESLPEQKVAEGNLLLPLSSVVKESLDQSIALDEPTGKTIQTGKWKKRWLQTQNGQKGMFDERKRNEWWLAIADVYEEYRQHLHGRGYYDYSDMVIAVIEELESNAGLRAEVQERFLYVLIDEFQDTNAAQLRLAHLVADHFAANGKPNLMAVGDDDQSIFAFNGAELNNMLSFRRSYPDTKLIVLKDNYRSAQAVLDVSKTIIEQAEDRLVTREPGITKNLHAQTKLTGKVAIAHLSYPTRQHQQLALAARVQERWQAGEGTIAVLARTHESLRQLAAILVAKQVPIRYERRSNVLEHPAVKQVFLIANLAVDIAAGNKAVVNNGLAQLLRHPMWGLKPAALWRLATRAYSSPDWLASLLDSDDERLNTIGNWLVWLARASSSQPLALTMEYILGLRESEYMVSPFKDYYLGLKPVTSEYLETLSAIDILRGLTQEFAGTENATLEDFVRFVDLNLRTERVVADESWFMSGERAVELLTIYKAKGLEYDHVFVIDATEDMWKPRIARRKSPANLQLQSYGEKYDDYARLLYVAATRAKTTLTATSYFTDGRGEQVLATPLLASLPLEVIDKPHEEPVAVLENDLHWPRLESKDERALLKPRLEEFYLSYSSMLDFLDVVEAGPSSFMERHLLRLPHAHSAQGSYGTAVHAALETAQRLTNTDALNTGTIIDRFESTLQDEHLAPLDYEQYLTKGTGLLKKLFDDKLIALPKGSLSEQKLNDILVGEARLGGKLDRLDTPDKHTLIVVDYKTGTPLTNLDTKDKTKTVKAWRYRSQLIFYCLLLRHSSRYENASSISGELTFLAAETPAQMTLSFAPVNEEIDRLALLAQAIWRKIMALDFPDTAKYSKDIEGIKQFEQDLLDGKI